MDYLIFIDLMINIVPITASFLIYTGSPGCYVGQILAKTIEPHTIHVDRKQVLQAQKRPVYISYYAR